MNKHCHLIDKIRGLINKNIVFINIAIWVMQLSL